MKFVCPLIVVEDMARSRNFYEKVLGQKLLYDWGENVSYKGDFAIHLRSHYQELIPGRKIRPGSHSFELYFEENDLVSVSERLKEAGVEFIHVLREEPWRQQVLRCYDPDRNVIEVGETMDHLCRRLHSEGKKVAEIVSITGLDTGFVEKALSVFP